ncbi:MAG: FmdE family protein [Eubacteriales bacterium]
MDKELWERSVKFHGHECPGLAIGVRACEAAMEKIGVKFAPDEEVVCVTENDACGVDAVQVITGCTMGKGNLIYHDTGKMAFSFFDRTNGNSIRVVLKPNTSGMDRKQRQEFILNAPVNQVFDFTETKFDPPKKARLFNNVICYNCGESMPEHKARIQNGKIVCLDCFEEYSRGWK